MLFLSISHSPLPVYAALLDLPVQPSATEVLGFSQTANASPSALPFRFYEQSRRAPNDPTANRSVFASVDKVPGDQGPLPTHAALACILRQTSRNSSFYASYSALSADIVDTKRIQVIITVRVNSGSWLRNIKINNTTLVNCCFITTTFFEY